MRARFSRLGVMVGIGLCAAGCQHRLAAVAPAVRPAPARPAALAAPPPPPASRDVASPAPLTEDELFRRKSLGELNAEHPLGDAFFDYNQNALRDDARASLQRDAAWLAKWPQTQVAIEGHCDERGTAEYNLALGEERAATIREYLVSLGVSPDRLTTKSLGKEAPFCTGDGEACWSQNRRGHFVITAK